MARLVCHMHKGFQVLLCVNNYRGKDYGKPESFVACCDCVFNPENKGLVKDLIDSHKIMERRRFCGK